MPPNLDELVSEVMELLAKRTGKRYNGLQLRALYRMADLDGSGSIDFNEFLHAQRRMKKNWGVAKAATYLSLACGGAGASAAASSEASVAPHPDGAAQQQ